MIFVVYKDSEIRDALLRNIEEWQEDSGIDDSWDEAIAQLNTSHMLFEVDDVVIHQLDLSDYEERWLEEFIRTFEIAESIGSGSVTVQRNVPEQLENHEIEWHFHYH